MLNHLLAATCRKNGCLILTATCLLLLSNSSVWSADKAKDSDQKKAKVKKETADVLAGHSYHGEVFNEGPRRKAYLMGGTGNVHFDVTVKNAEAQKFLDQGLGQLHGFWYLEAERSFRHAATLDPDCAMAFWGAAMCNLKNKKRAKGFIEEANKRITKASPREKLYIKALEAYINADKKKSKQRNDAYTKAMENLILEYPDDLEAKAFLAVHLYNSRSASTSYIAAEALLQDIFAVNPMHPAHHYRIHLWDYRKPETALTSAARCGQSAPRIAHMWHMPGHIYSRLKRYDDAVWQQEASARVDHAHMMRDAVMPDQIHNYAHNNEWLIRNLIFIGHAYFAAELAKNMIDLPQHPKYNTLKKRGSAKYGRMRLFQVLRTYEMWNDLIYLSGTHYLAPTDLEEEQHKRLRYLGLAYYQTKKIKEGDAQLAKLQTRLDKLNQDLEQIFQTARKKAKAKRIKEPIVALKPNQSKLSKAGKLILVKIKRLEGHVNALKGHQAIAGGDFKRGHQLLKQGSGVDNVYLISVLWKSGEQEKAEKALRKLIEAHKNEVPPQAILVDLLWHSGKKEAAKKEFRKLKTIATTIDPFTVYHLKSFLYERLALIKKELGLVDDGDIKKIATNVGKRPDLKKLGPYYWKPSPAPSWKLKDATGKVRSSEEFRGKPHVLIFYLGFSCLHCAEQLQAFAPMVDEFEKAGFPLMAISTDNIEGLKTSIKNYDKGDLPIPLFSNDKLDVFKAFHAYDDFEKQPLHGTFIIDGKGKVVWQDISYDPFMDPKFVLKEAQRVPRKDPWPGMKLDVF